MPGGWCPVHHRQVSDARELWREVYAMLQEHPWQSRRLLPKGFILSETKWFVNFVRYVPGISGRGSKLYIPEYQEYWSFHGRLAVSLKVYFLGEFTSAKMHSLWKTWTTTTCPWQYTRWGTSSPSRERFAFKLDGRQGAESEVEDYWLHGSKMSFMCFCVPAFFRSGWV